MKCKGAEVQFKSNSDAYWFEKEGLKNHTERLLSVADEKLLTETRIKQIRISSAEQPSPLFFIRQITNIYKEGEILGHSLYSFTWKHEEEVRK